MVTWPAVGLGFLLAIAVAFAACRLRSLTGRGAAAAVVVGGLTFGVGGPLAGALLLLFFVSSTLLSNLGERNKSGVAAGFEKGSRRDDGQVLANGGAAALLSVAYGIWRDPLALAGLVGALAAVTADTWSTEVGVLARRPPRLVTTWREVAAGTSGAVTPEGLLAGAAGAALIGVSAWLGAGRPALVGAAIVGGVLGSLVDSLLGATAQAMYFCPTCRRQTERHPLHGCGTPTTRSRGLPWLRNDAVNVAASLTGAAAALVWLAAAAPIPGVS